MNIEQTTLPNGLRVVSVNLPGFDSAAVAAFVKAGARNETEANNGIAHFLEHMAFKGTRTRSALQIGAEIEVLGSNVNAYTSHETTCYFVTGLKGTIDRSVAIIGDVLCNSVFEPKDIETEKGVILQEIRRATDNPSHVAYDGYGLTAYPGQSIGRPILGRAELIEQVTILLGLQSVPETDATVYAHKVLARALGGGMSSPLFQEVREKRGLVYSVGAYSDHGVDHGELVMHAGTTAKHVDELLDVACGELVKMTETVTEADLTRAKNGLLVRLATAKERPFSLAQGIAGSLFEHGEIQTPEYAMQKVEAVTLADVTAAARAIVRSNPTVSLVGPVPDADYHGRVRAALA